MLLRLDWTLGDWIVLGHLILVLIHGLRGISCWLLCNACWVHVRLIAGNRVVAHVLLTIRNVRGGNRRLLDRWILILVVVVRL